MLSWLPSPLLRVSLIFIPGIYAGFELSVDPKQLEWWWLGCFIFFLWFRVGAGIRQQRNQQSSGNDRNNWFDLIRCIDLGGSFHRNLNPFIGFLGLTLIFTGGLLRAQWKSYHKDPIIAQAEYYQAKVTEPPCGQNQKLILQIEWVCFSDSIYTTNDGVLWIYSSNDSNAGVGNRLSPGTRVIIKGSPIAIRPPANPNEFNYAKFRSRQNVFWQHWVRNEDVLKIIPFKQSGLKNWLAKSRVTLNQIIADQLPTGASKEISLAMLLGDRLAVTEDLKSSFADSGAIHILAVSGLHLGILYWIVVRLFGRLRKDSRLKWAFVLIGMLVLWAYTLITGMSPATQRAAIMFTFLLLGNALNLHSGNSNSLGAAAMLILYLDPYQIYSVGFQLSFTALAGILYLQPILIGPFAKRQGPSGYFWEVASVSLSAQIAVLPISVFYFHQMPLYFLLTNLLVIPLAFGIVLTGVFLFSLHLIPVVAEILAGILELLTAMAAGIVNGLADMPGSTIQELYLEPTGVAVWYILILVAARLLMTRYKIYLRLLIGILVTIMVWTIILEPSIKKRQLLSIYHIPNHTAIDLVSGQQYATILDSRLANDPNTTEYKIKNFRRFLGLGNSSFQIIITDQHPGFEIWKFNGKRVLLVKSIPKDSPVGIQLSFDIVVVISNSLSNIQQITPWIEADYWVIDGSNKPWDSDKLESQAIQQGLRVHNCWKDGAFILTI